MHFNYQINNAPILLIILTNIYPNSAGITHNVVNNNISEIKSDLNDDDSNIKYIEVTEKLEVDDTRVLSLNYSDVDCVGDASYCNLTEEEYMIMMNNYIYPRPYEWVLITTHTVVFVVGLIGNALVCVAVYSEKSMRTVTNYFIVNLAVADFMVILFCLPPTVLWDVTETWFLGEALCKMLLYFQSVSVTVSVLTLTFISVDRWYAICFPLKFKSTTGWAKTTILKIWLTALTFNIPDLVVLSVVRMIPLRFELDYLLQCMATWSERSDLIWHILKVLFMYTIPLILMSVAYYQIVRVLWRSNHIPGCGETFTLASAEQTRLLSRRKAAKMLVAVVVMFAVCSFPVHLLSVLRYTLQIEQNDKLSCLALVSHILCYANSAMNPLIYNFMSDKFRRQFRQSFCCSGLHSHMFTKFDSSVKTRPLSYSNSQSKPTHNFELQSSYKADQVESKRRKNPEIYHRGGNF